ncbi:MAG: virginiamycin lyase [Frankiales bacterium]|jgi:sugar lactone lactonase YvrE|nr:virginiamycin lyase [Frankiales bacterium]
MRSSTARRLSLLALVALAAVSCGGSTGPSGAKASPTPTPVATLSTAMTVALQSGDAPQNLIFAFGSLWVAAHHAGALLRVDPVAGKVIARIPVGVGPGSAMASGDSIWVVDYQSPALVQVNAATNKVVRTVALPANGCCQAAITGHLVWVSSGEGDSANLDAYDTRTGARVRRIPFLASPVFTLGKLWADTSLGELVQIDPATGAKTTTAGPSGFGFTAGSESHGLAWASSGGGNVAGLDATGATKVQGHRTNGEALGRGESQVVAGPNDVWLGDELGELLRIDPTTGEATTVAQLGATYLSLVVTPGRLWVAEFDTDRLTGFATT